MDKPTFDLFNYSAETAKNSMEIEGFRVTDGIHEAAINKAKRLIESGEVDRRFEEGAKIGADAACKTPQLTAEEQNFSKTSRPARAA